jgi:hypothetical protein
MSAPFEDGPAPLSIRVSPTYRVGKPDPHGGLYQISQFLHVRFEDLKRANPWLAHRHWQLSGGEILTIPPVQPARGPSEQPQPARAGTGPHSAGQTQTNSSSLAPQPSLPNRETKTPPTPPLIRTWLAGGGQVVQVGGMDLFVAGGQATFQRQIYSDLLDWTFKTATKKLESGETERDVAQWCVWQRNSIKQFVRESGPTLFKRVVEQRNRVFYGNRLGPNYSEIRFKFLRKGVPAADIDKRIIMGSRKTSRIFDKVGPTMKLLGVVMEGTALVVTAVTADNSPESLDPLPVSPEEELEREEVRLRYGIPATANIDRHGHLKPGFYLQIDIEDPHVDREIEAETDEILWYMGVDITYSYNGHKWTVPGQGSDVDQDLLRRSLQKQERFSVPAWW